MNPLTRAVFLNYHLHKAHDVHPRMPWRAACRTSWILASREPQPGFWHIYLEMWRGPKPAESPALAAVRDPGFRSQIADEDLPASWIRELGA